MQNIPLPAGSSAGQKRDTAPPPGPAGGGSAHTGGSWAAEADKSRSKATGGTGLGLAIVKHIARIHNARIKLESEIGEGTTITVLFETAH